MTQRDIDKLMNVVREVNYTAAGTCESPYWKKPEGISKLGEAAWKVITDMAVKGKWSTGGCHSFYSPQEWADRGEQYGLESELIVCHDGGALAPRFNLDYLEYDKYDAMLVALNEGGVFPEACTTWYSAIYQIPLGNEIHINKNHE